MKNLKKVTAGFLSLSLLTCVGATQVFAKSPITASGGSDSKQAKVGALQTVQNTYSVKIDWGDLQYDYVEKWNTTEFKNTHEWTRHTTHSSGGDTEDSNKTEDSDKITITNNSNVAIKATFKFAPATGDKNYSGVSGKFYSDSGHVTPLNAGKEDALELEKASNGLKAPEGDAYMKLTGEPTNVTPTPGDTIGDVTVTISEPPNQD